MSEPLPRPAAETDQLATDIIDLFEHKIRFNEHLGLEVTDLWGDSVTTAFNMRPEFVGHYLYGRLHGGVISSVLDTTGGLAVMSAVAKARFSETRLQVLEQFKYLGTLDMRIDYLRPGLGHRFIADAEIVRLGRRIATTRMNLRNEEGVLIATGNAAFVVSGS
jgi:uncharacterized protein (TIGR00369 family)